MAIMDGMIRSSPRRTTLALVRYAQEALGSAFADRARRNGTVLHPGRATWVDTDDLAPHLNWPREIFHYSSAARVTLGERFAAAMRRLLRPRPPGARDGTLCLTENSSAHERCFTGVE